MVTDLLHGHKFCINRNYRSGFREFICPQELMLNSCTVAIAKDDLIS